MSRIETVIAISRTKRNVRSYREWCSSLQNYDGSTWKKDILMVTLGIHSQDVGVKRKRKFDLVHPKFQKSLIWQANAVDLICLTLSIWELLTFGARHSQWLSGKESGCSAGDIGLIPVLGRFPGGGSGNPLQCSCLGNPMDRWTWLNTVHGAANSWTQLSNQTTSTTNSLLWGCAVHCRKFSLDASSTGSQSCWSKVSSDFWQMSAAGQNCPWLRTTNIDVHFQLIECLPKRQTHPQLWRFHRTWADKEANQHKTYFWESTYYVSGTFPSIAPLSP